MIGDRYAHDAYKYSLLQTSYLLSLTHSLCAYRRALFLNACHWVSWTQPNCYYSARSQVDNSLCSLRRTDRSIVNERGTERAHNRCNFLQLLLLLSLYATNYHFSLYSICWKSKKLSDNRWSLLLMVVVVTNTKKSSSKWKQVEATNKQRLTNRPTVSPCNWL